MMTIARGGSASTKEGLLVMSTHSLVDVDPPRAMVVMQLPHKGVLVLHHNLRHGTTGH